MKKPSEPNSIERVVLRDEANMMAVATVLSGYGVWFQVRPLPDGRLELSYPRNAEAIVRQTLHFPK